MKTSAVVRVAPMMLLAMLGIIVCFLVACGHLSDEEEGSTDDAICSNGYGYGYGRCSNGYGYGTRD
jgi:hypothetical protein